VDFGKFREIADEVGALLMADIAHISGLVATGLHPAPFEHCDVVTTTTHKSLRGPRSGMIFFKYSDKFLDRCCQIALKVQEEKGKKLKDFEAGLVGNSDVKALRGEVEAWASSFGYPGL